MVARGRNRTNGTRIFSSGAETRYVPDGTAKTSSEVSNIFTRYGHLTREWSRYRQIILDAIGYVDSALEQLSKTEQRGRQQRAVNPV